MKTEQQIKALAELDGCDDLWVVMKRGLYYRPQARGYTSNINEAWVCTHSTAKAEEYLRGDEPVTINPAPLKPYLTSYDAIIPLIQKQDGRILREIGHLLLKDCCGNFGEIAMQGIQRTPSQLCEALLHATRKWNE